MEGPREASGDKPQPARWYYLEDEKQRGPTDLATMRRLVVEGSVRTDTYVWADGMPDWMRAADVPAITPPPGLR